MNTSEFEQTIVTLGVVFSTTLAEVPRLKERILSALRQCPESRVIYQRISPGRLRIETEGEQR